MRRNFRLLRAKVPLFLIHQNFYFYLVRTLTASILIKMLFDSFGSDKQNEIVAAMKLHRFGRMLYEDT